MRDCVLAVDLFSDCSHEDGDRLLESLRERAAGLTHAIEVARDRSLPVIYANDTFGIWNGDAKGLVRRALTGRAATCSKPSRRGTTTHSS